MCFFAARSRWRDPAIVLLAAGVFCLCIFITAIKSARAGDDKPDRNYEVWAGADAAADVWLIYSGTTLAPYGDIHEDGLRLRAAGGYGQYRYRTSSAAHGFKEVEFRAQTEFADALVGYLKRMGPLTAKGFVGLSAINHRVFPHDGANRVQGLEIGAKGVVELWLNMGSDAWSSLDLSWSTAHNTRSARTRVGYRIQPGLSTGIEAAINVDDQAEFKLSEEVIDHRSSAFDYARVGTFVRYDWYGGEISASAGYLGDFTQNESVYGTLNWIKQF